MKSLEKFAATVVDQMKMAKITQLDLANHTGLSIKTIRAIVQGKEGVAIKNWLLVADILGLEFNLQIKKMNNETRNSL